MGIKNKAMEKHVIIILMVMLITVSIIIPLIVILIQTAITANTPKATGWASLVGLAGLAGWVSLVGLAGGWQRARLAVLAGNLIMPRDPAKPPGKASPS